MKRYVHAELLNRLLLTVIAILLVSFASAQSPGLIIREAVNSGQNILDPNGDGYISTTPAGFAGTSDIGSAVSEIPYRPIPTLTTEPIGDIRNGTTGGHTDFVSPAPLQAFFDGQNLMFRMRLGGTSTSRRGYSVLIDSDNTFGGTGTNPGFEYEIVLSSGFDIKLIQHEGSTRQTLLNGASSQFSQRAVAASNAGGDADYFIDFYVPISAFGGQITASTPLRMAASTVNMGQSALADLTVVADVAGVNFQSYNFDTQAAWRDVIETFPPVTLNNLVTGQIGQIRTFPPYITSPITTDSTAIAGTSREPAGTVIRVFRNESTTPIATATVTADGTWLATLGTGVTLTEGDLITATATASGRPTSVASNTVIVLGPDCDTPPLPDGSFSISPNGRSISGSIATGEATVTVYRNGVQLGTATASNTGDWSFNACPQQGTNNCIGSGEFTVTQTPVDGCESPPAAPVYNILTEATPAPTFSTPVCVTSTTLSGTAAPGAYVTLYYNDRPIYLIRDADNAYTVLADQEGNWSLIANLGFAEGDELFVRARTDSNYYGESEPISVVAVCPTEAPVITGEYCGTTTTVSGTSTAPAGTLIRIYVAGEAQEETGLVNESGFWTVTGLEIPEGTAFTATATAPNSLESDASEPVTASIQTTAEGLTINPGIIEGANSISGTGIPFAQLTLYIGGTPYTPISIPESGQWTLSGFASRELFAGAEITATQTVTGQCESEFAESVFVDCNPLTTTFTISADVPEQVCGGTTSVSLTLANSEVGVAYVIILPDSTVSGSARMGMGDSITLTSGPIPNVTGEPQEIELRVLARRVTGSLGPDLPPSCEAILNDVVTVTVLPQPPVEYEVEPVFSPTCAGQSVDVVLTVTDPAYTYQFIDEGTGSLVGAPVQGNTEGGSITLSAGPINTFTTYGVLITNTSTGCTFIDAGAFTGFIQGPSITGLFEAVREGVCPGGPGELQLATQAGYTYNVYQIGPTEDTTPIVYNGSATIAGNGSTLTILTPTLVTEGQYTYYALVSGDGCDNLEILSRPTILVSTQPGIADAGPDRTVCGSSSSLTAASPSPGIGRWAFLSGPEGSSNPISNPNSPTTAITGLVTGVYEFTWSVTTECASTGPVTVVDTLAITVNCPSTYVILPPKYRDEYLPQDFLALAEDPDGGIISASIVAGSLPPGTELNAEDGNIFVENPDALLTGIYTFSVNLTDSTGAETIVTLTLEILEDSPTIVPLPVELVYFTAYVRNNQAHLEWLTASEQDNDRFEIERSLDAKRFEKIGTVKGKGTTSLESKYQFVDRTPVQGTVYYRLKQVDFDGEFAYSNIIAVSADGLANHLVTKVYPNPFPDVLKVTLTAPQSQVATMSIYDMNGRRVLSKNVDLEIGVNNMELQLQQLQSGMYILKIVGEGLESTTRIMKH